MAAIELVMAGPADDVPAVLLQCEAPPAPEECPPLAVAAVLAPAVAAIVTKGLSSEKDPGADAEVAGHYSVSTSTPNGPPVLALHSTEEGSSDDIEAILLQAEATQVDRFLSLAQHQKVLGEKVRKATAARNRRAAAKKAAAIP